MLREKRRFNAKLINISKKEGTKKSKAFQCKPNNVRKKQCGTQTNMEEKRQTKRIKIEE